MATWRASTTTFDFLYRKEVNLIPTSTTKLMGMWDNKNIFMLKVQLEGTFLELCRFTLEAWERLKTLILFEQRCDMVHGNTVKMTHFEASSKSVALTLSPSPSSKEVSLPTTTTPPFMVPKAGRQRRVTGERERAVKTALFYHTTSHIHNKTIYSNSL